MSLGLRDERTEAQYEAFIEGRAELKLTLASLKRRLEQMAPVNRALGLGRVPTVAARIVRALNRENLLGQHLLIVGTNAVFCYESAAGVFVEAGLLATTDADFLWDSRQRVSLVSQTVREQGLLKVLQRTDRSFALRSPHDFRAVNRDGFFVDVIRPETKDIFSSKKRQTVGGADGDIQPAPIFGLRWLVNSPRFEAVAVGEDGLPVHLVVPDPRAFALHKLWVSARPERDPLKRERDVAQAKIVLFIARTYFNMVPDSDDLQALPGRLRELAEETNS